MSELTLDEAIKHCLEVANSKEMKAEFETDYVCYFMTDKEREECKECATDHRQLAEWLTELKQWRRVYGICPSYEMCIPECKEGYDAQIAEYKRLLKVAVEDFAVYGALKDLSAEQRVQNPDWRRFNRIFDILDHQWRYADEALKLLND